MQLATEDACSLVSSALQGLGFPHADAEIAARHLVEADRIGQSAMGVSRIRMIESHVQAGGVADTPHAVISETPTSLHLDARGGMGYRPVEEGLNVVADKARTMGIAVLGVRNFYLSGALRVYVRDLAITGLASVVFNSSAPASIAAPGGLTPVIGTNPIAMGLPSAIAPIVWDVGMSNITWSELTHRASKAEALQPGWAIDHEGIPTTDPRSALEGAMLAWGGGRGFGLGVMIQLFGMLAGAPAYASKLDDCGFLGFVFDPQVFASDEEWEARTSEFRGVVHGSGTSQGANAPRLPGEESARSSARIRAAGITLDADTAQTLTRLASRR